MRNYLIRIPVRYGILGSVLGAALIIVLYRFQHHPFLIPVALDFRIILFGILIFFALREFRDLRNEGVMFFWQGMVQCFIFVSVYGALVALGIIVLGKVDARFVSDYVRQFTEQARQFPKEVIEQIGREQFERSLTELKDTTIYEMAFTYLVQCYAIGVFVSIILSVILRRQPKPQF